MNVQVQRIVGFACPNRQARSSCPSQTSKKPLAVNTKASPNISDEDLYPRSIRQDASKLLAANHWTRQRDGAIVCRLAAVCRQPPLSVAQGHINLVNIGTLIFTWFNGVLVGTDEFGTKYYHSKRKKRWGREQRWCIYKGAKDPSRVPAEWHAWLHHTVSEPLTQIVAEPCDWQKPHQANQTGTVESYRPAGQTYKGGTRVAATEDYEAWAPE